MNAQLKGGRADGLVGRGGDRIRFRAVLGWARLLVLFGRRDAARRVYDAALRRAMRRWQKLADRRGGDPAGSLLGGRLGLGGSSFAKEAGEGEAVPAASD